jgi:Ca2+/H+ antiporter, TMEM165/GDT1 family
MSPWIAAGTTFLASALEFVEAATIVLAVGYTIGWRAALTGAAWALVVLTVIAGLLGPALVNYVPLPVLQIAIGLFLLIFGYTWLRKAIWRYAGRKAMRNEQSAYEADIAKLQAHRDEQRFGLATSFNGVLLEGLEVAVIVITFSAGRAGSFVYAAAGALVAGLIVAITAVILRHPFSKVPENAMGFIVGVMLLSFGTYWSGEGLGLQWWAGEATLAWIVAIYIAAALLLIAVWRRRVTA